TLFGREGYEEMTFADAAEDAVAVEVWEMTDTGIVERFVMDDVARLVSELENADEFVDSWDSAEDDRYYTLVFASEDVLSYRVNVHYSDSQWYAAIDGEWFLVDLDE